MTVIPSNLFCIYNLIPVLISPCCFPQLFLHSVFGYRGIVLFPWHARLYDRDITPPISDRWPSISRLQQTLVFGFSRVTLKCLFSCSKREPPGAHGSKEVKGKTHTYYQVLIDTRDCPHIVSPYLLLSNDDFKFMNWLFLIDDAVFWRLLGGFSVSALPDRSGDIPGQPRWQQSPVRHPRYAATSWSIGVHHWRAFDSSFLLTRSGLCEPWRHPAV